jgi:hypothetical protein
MKLLAAISLAVTFWAVSVMAQDPLIIEQTYIPANCPLKTAAGDKLSMHYVRSNWYK